MYFNNIFELVTLNVRKSNICSNWYDMHFVLCRTATAQKYSIAVISFNVM